MSKAQRYDHGRVGMIPTDCGYWYQASDYAKLEAEAQALREEVERSEQHRNDQADLIVSLRTEVAALRARVVVVPERKPIPDQMTFPGGPAYFAKVFDEVASWNSCLDELARLNGKAVSLADISECLDAELREWTGDHRKAVERALTDAHGRILTLLGEGKEHE